MIIDKLGYVQLVANASIYASTGIPVNSYKFSPEMWTNQLFVNFSRIIKAQHFWVQFCWYFFLDFSFEN